MEWSCDTNEDPAALETYRPMSAILSGCVQELGYKSGKVSAGWAWNKIAGPRGRAHTRGVFLQTQSAPRLPLLRVYLDSSVLIQDFSTDHLLFEQRLSEVGLPVERVVFQLSRTVGTTPQGGAEVVSGFSAGNKAEKPQVPHPVALESLPPLSEEQKQRVAQLTSGLEGELRQAAARAMETSLRRGHKESQGIGEYQQL